jgi:hypothetical protein
MNATVNLLRSYVKTLNVLNIREFFSGFLLLTLGDKVDFGCPAT